MAFTIKDPVPALRFNGTLSNRARTTGIVIHHYAHPAREGQALALPQDVHRWHLDRGWAGIGYNFIVDQCGAIWNGRGMEAVGAHAANHNGTTIGIACQGNFDSVHREMPAAQFNALIWLIKHIRGIYGQIPIHAHSDLAATACPGRFFPLEEVINAESRSLEGENEMRFNTVAEIAKAHSWAAPTIESLIKKGLLRGNDGNGKGLDLSLDMVRMLVLNDRAGLYDRIA